MKELLPTPSIWVDAVLGDFNSFLVDHALCERKAHASALSLISRYPQEATLIEPMICLAKEELEHFHQVYRLLMERGLSLAQQSSDDYVKRLRSYIRHPEEFHLLDRLIVCSLIEARSAERFMILADTLEAGVLKDFYVQLAKVEKGHWKVFSTIAKRRFPKDFSQRFDELANIEGQCMSEVAIGARVH